MTQFQLQKNTHSLDDIWTSFGAHHSSCCVHLINHGQELDIAAVTTPILVSRGTPHWPVPTEFLHAVITVKCLLTILSLSASGPHKDYFLDMVNPTGSWGALQKILPQTYIIHASAEDHVSWLDSRLLSELDMYHWPQIFVLQRDSSSLEQIQGTFRIKFYCWYCRGFNVQRDHWQIPLEIIEATCSTQGLNCSNVLKDIVSVPDAGVQLWMWSAVGPGFQLAPVDPLSRVQTNFKMEDAVAGFLHGINQPTTLWAYYISHKVTR